jgi:hypothetical protein
MRVLLLSGLCAAIAGCAAGNGTSLDVTLLFDDSVTDDALARVTRLSFTANGDETGQFNLTLSRPARRAERLIYRPLASTRSLLLTIAADAADGTTVAQGSTPVLSLVPGRTLATAVTLTGELGGQDAAVDDVLPDLASSDEAEVVGHVVFTSAAQTLNPATCSGAVELQLEGPGNAPLLAKSAMTVSLTVVGKGPTFYSDSACTTAVTTVSIAAGSSSTSFYVEGVTAGSSDIVASLAAGQGPAPTQLVTINPFSSLILSDSPVAYWKLDEASGTMMIDSTANAHNGTYTAVGITYQAVGAILPNPDYAVAFNGTSGASTVANSAALNPPAVSAEAWIYPTSYANSYARILDKGGDCDGGGYDLEFNAVSLNGVRWVIWDVSSPNNLDSDAVVPLNQWTHVVGTFDGTNMKMYVNGVLQSQHPTATMSVNSQALTIGVENGTCTQNYFPGTLDELAIYDHVLTALQVARHYHASGR